LDHAGNWRGRDSRRHHHATGPPGSPAHRSAWRPLAFYEESPGGTVAVVEQQAGHNHFKRLYIQGVSNSGDGMPSVRYMRLQALLPLIIHRGEPRRVLVIGLGTGITAGALLACND
jgi:spermidine synthase